MLDGYRTLSWYSFLMDGWKLLNWLRFTLQKYGPSLSRAFLMLLPYVTQAEITRFLKSETANFPKTCLVVQESISP